MQAESTAGDARPPGDGPPAHCLEARLRLRTAQPGKPVMAPQLGCNRTWKHISFLVLNMRWLVSQGHMLATAAVSWASQTGHKGHPPRAEKASNAPSGRTAMML